MESLVAYFEFLFNLGHPCAIHLIFQFGFLPLSQLMYIHLLSIRSFAVADNISQYKSQIRDVSYCSVV